VELNTKARYAVMAMADLAKHGEAAAVPLSAIAERQALSLAYLEQIFLRLRRAGLVASARGRAGGYVLARPARFIHIADIMNAVEEETRMTRCLDADVGCLGDQRCLTHGLWHALGGHIAAFLANVSLQEVIDGIPAAKLAEKPLPQRELMAR
jgi:Rrf2 family transcriptional regulator, iron-sulfur cluster assembly transcription factor